MAIIEDIIDHLDANWNVLITSKPDFLNGHKQLAEGMNYVWVYNNSVNYVDATADGTMRNGTYSCVLKVKSSESYDKRELMLSEVERIFGKTFITGYIYNKVNGLRHADTSKDWITRVFIELNKFLEEK